MSNAQSVHQLPNIFSRTPCSRTAPQQPYHEPKKVLLITGVGTFIKFIGVLKVFYCKIRAINLVKC